MKVSAMYLVILLVPCFSAHTQLALPNNFEPNANEAALSALMTKQLLEDSKSMIEKCINCVGKCINCATTKIKGLFRKKTEEPVQKPVEENKKRMAAIEAHAARKEVFNRSFSITETTMNEKTYLIIALQHDSQLNNLKIERNEYLGAHIFLYKEMNDVFKDGILNNSLQKTIVEKLYRHWTNMTQERKSTAQLLITGHAIGGGLAQILGMYLKSRTESLLSHLMLTEYDEPTFANMLNEVKIYTFSTPFVFLKEPKREITDFNTLQRGAYNFLSKTDTVEVTATSFREKFWDMFASAIMPSYIVVSGAYLWKTMTFVHAIIGPVGAILTSVLTEAGTLNVVIEIALLTVGLGGMMIGGAMLSAACYAIYLDPKVGFGAVKNINSKAHPEPIIWGSNYLPSAPNSEYALVGQSLLKDATKSNWRSLHINHHIRKFSSNTAFVTRKALPAPKKNE